MFDYVDKEKLIRAMRKREIKKGLIVRVLEEVINESKSIE